MRRYSALLALVFLAVACSQQPTISPTHTPAPPPAPTATPTAVLPEASPTPRTHVVQPGDLLSSIALEYGVTAEAIVQANGIQDANVIRAGQVLVIPNPTPTPGPTQPPTPTPTPHLPPQLEIVDVIGRGAPTAEIVVVVNRGRPVSLDTWTLRDSQGNVYVFPKLYLATDTEVRVHTGVGENDPLHLFWGRDTAVWQEAGDTAVLADERGVVHASKRLD